MRCRALVAALLMVSGCGAPSVMPSYRPLMPLVSSMGLAPNGARSMGQTELLVDGDEIFPAAYDVIRSAKRSIQVEIFMFGATIGRKMGDLLLAKKAEGVDVQLVIDPHMGGTPKVQAQIKPVIDYLVSQGLEVRQYPTKKLPAPHPWLKGSAINHCKIIVADRERALVGGMNFLDSEAINRDYMLKVSGGLAQELGDLVDRDWQFSAGKSRASRAPGLELGETGPNQASVKTLWLQSIRNASRSIDIEMLLMDNPEGVSALIDAHKRGVAVRVLLDKTNLAKHSYDFIEKLPLKGAPNWSAVQRLLDAGVDVSWYKPRQPLEMLHTKSAIIDGTTALMGTANFTLRAWGQNREVTVRFTDPAAINRLQGEYRLDFGQRADKISRLTRWQSAVAKIWARVLAGKTSAEAAEREIDAMPADDGRF